MHPPIHLYNTASKKLELFVPINEDKARIYSCGPTVYHFAHIGNLRAYIFADTLRRILIRSGYEVTHVINITDVGHLTDDGDHGEDKLEKGSRREGKTAWEVAAFYEDAFMKDLTALNIPLSAYGFPRATDHIREQITLISTLEEKGYTYTVEGDGVYFDTEKFERYRDLAQLDLEGLKSGARVEENKAKRSPSDFALWKFSPKSEKRQMEWDSPWGLGFPGWHIECSAMAMKYLGEHFDIHTGGVDHIKVHHTNEVAQSECATGGKYVNYWMHVNFLQDKSGKISKSNDDFLTLESLVKKGYTPQVFRYFILTTHYRKELTFTYEALDAVKVAYKKLSDHVLRCSHLGGTILDSYMGPFMEALRDDCNTSEAIAYMWKMIKEVQGRDTDVAVTLLKMDELLGLGLDTLKEEVLHLPNQVELLLEERMAARRDKNFTESDRLREEVRKLGYIVRDSPDGQEVAKI
jgi:cysteinyl-tRNA synthetase